MANKVESSREIIFCQDKEDLADKAAWAFLEIARTKEASATCNVALSGGSTPKILYERLLKDDLRVKVPWDRMAFYVSDERCVPHESNESNWGNAYRQLLGKLQLRDEQRHPTTLQDLDPDESASLYEEEIRKALPFTADKVPRFDVIFLGMGPDGHTASLFPGTQGLSEKTRLVLKNHVPKFNADRISFSFPLINNAANVIFLASGEDKAEVLAEVLEGVAGHPAASVMPVSGKLFWFVDRAAASKLKI